MKTPSLISYLVFSGTTVLLLIFLFYYLRQRLKTIEAKRYTRMMLTLCAWILFIGLVSLSGFIQDFSTIPPRFVVILLPTIAFMLYVGFSTKGREYSTWFPLKALTYLQAFRIIVEYGLWQLYQEGIVPIQMTWDGRNIDVLIGLTAIPVAYFSFNKPLLSKYILLVWNILGIAAVTNILIVALLSTPTSLRVFMNEPANTFIGHFPFAYLPGLLVPAAYLMHILSIRKIWSERNLKQ
jgi:hypothetical protein